MTDRPSAAAPPDLPRLDPSAIPVGRFRMWQRGDPRSALSPLPALVTEPIGDPRTASEAINLPADEIRGRMERGHRPWLARIGDEPVGWGWSAGREFAIGELGIARALPPRMRYLWDFVTCPAQRGRGIYPRVLRAIVVGEPEVERFWVGHDLDNTSSERGIAKAGFGEVGLLHRGDGGFALVPTGAVDRAVAASALFDVPLAATITTTRRD